MMKYLNRENLVPLFAAMRAGVLNDNEKRELRRALASIERRNSRTLTDCWHFVRVNSGCVSYGTIFAGTRWTCGEVRRMVKALFECNGILVIKTAQVKKGIAVRVDVYPPLKKKEGKRV